MNKTKGQLKKELSEWKKRHKRVAKLADRYATAIALMSDGVRYEDLPKKYK